MDGILGAFTAEGTPERFALQRNSNPPEVAGGGDGVLCLDAQGLRALHGRLSLHLL